MRKIIAVLFISLFFTCAWSQVNYSFPESFNQGYNFKPDEAHQILMKNRDQTVQQRDFENYVVNYLYNSQFRFDNNQVYLDWYEPESYLIKFFDSIFPKNIDRKNLIIFLYKSAAKNAFTTRQGFVMCNSGLFQKAPNEVFLATVLLHEAAHYLFKHHVHDAELSHELFAYNKASPEEVKKFFERKRKEEFEADTFAFNHIAKMGGDLSSFASYFEQADMKSRAYQYSISYKGMLKASNQPKEVYQQRKKKMQRSYSSHPSYLERMESVHKIMEKFPSNKKQYLYDSVTFHKVKKKLDTEIKKLAFESANYDAALSNAFVDYLYNPKNLKNIFYIIESLRRIMYARPELEITGFLTENEDDDELIRENHSILYKPEYLLDDFEEYEKLKMHPFFSSENKPFNSYRQAFFYFISEARNNNLNEENLSLGLYYYAHKQQDSSMKYLKNYVDNGIGLFMDFAKEMLNKARPGCQGNKLLMVYDNLGNYTHFDFNYFLSKKRKKYNPEIRALFGVDTAKTELVIMNDLLGNKPALLHQYQKLQHTLMTLYQEADVEIFKKTRISARETMEERALSSKYWKHLLVYAPEWYNWFHEKNIGKIMYTDVIYQYKEYMAEEEFYNNYTAYYIDFSAQRPYFKDAVRNGFIRKEKEKEILNALNNFLYGSE